MALGTRGLVVIGSSAALLLAFALGYSTLGRGSRLPAVETEGYQQVVRAFYRGLAALDTGLLDNARSDFARATEVAADEPSAWANLALVHLRRSEFDQADGAITAATRLAPDNGDVALIEGALHIARGTLDGAIASFRRAARLDAQSATARVALADAIERSGGDLGEAQQLLDEVLRLQPSNLAVIVDRARLAARRGDPGALDDATRQLDARSAAWPPVAREQLGDLRSAASGRQYQAAARAVAFLRNVLARVPDFREGLADVRVPAELMAEPLRRFLDMPTPSATPAPRDSMLTFAREPLGATAQSVSAVLAWPADASGAASLFAVSDASVRRLDAAGEWPLSSGRGGPSSRAVALDWNNDFRIDLAVTGSFGVRLLLQDNAGTFREETSVSRHVNAPSVGAYPADVEMDGDLDIVVALVTGDPIVLRNNGDGTAEVLRPFSGVAGLRGFAWGDVDADGDPDAAMLDAAGALHVFVNQQAGAFERRAPPSGGPVVSLLMADVDADGRLDLVTLDRGGSVQRASVVRDGWSQGPVLSGVAIGAEVEPGVTRLSMADFDNNGGLDLLVAGPAGSRVWLSDERNELVDGPVLARTDITGTLDLNGDGVLDLVGVSAGQPVRLLGRSTRGYHWQVIRPRAQTAAGDQRINAFGVGGEIEVRAGLLVQKQLLSGAPVHVGLGPRTVIDVARIVWPNGVMQAEFDMAVDGSVVAEQRLKGSCPWVFAYDGTGMGFVTDFLWRSPLGLRINAQDTAGVGQTEDWVKIRGDQLVPRDGVYDVRITAELWETHFFDHVSLMVVDHPANVDIFVDERFARQAPELKVSAFSAPHPLGGAWDDQGRDVSALVAARDGEHAAGFERGLYQGVARPHALEIELGADAPATGPLWLVAYGWVYPTDSSINVAIAQGHRAPPHGLALDVQDADGTWRVVNPDLGFPAGKNKTVLIDLSTRPRGAKRFRLRTEMEIYWDHITWATPAPGDEVRISRIEASVAELRYRGFSRTDQDVARHAPELPRYDAVANTSARWRDLVGYHTRFGPVGELLDRVDDRYVIMNAGDELRLSFPAPPLAPGATRDFVLVGDGWEKDGDFNTGYSKTVTPLPLHDRPDYGGTPPTVNLEDEAAYRRHPDDWQRFHTRFVTPERYLLGLRTTSR